jgi:hypothetical protein
MRTLRERERYIYSKREIAEREIAKREIAKREIAKREITKRKRDIYSKV